MMNRAFASSMLLVSFAFFFLLVDAFQPSKQGYRKQSTSQYVRSNHDLRMSLTEASLTDEAKRHVELGRIAKFAASTTMALFFSSVLNADLNHLERWTDLGQIYQPLHAEARNLPTSNGASGANRGTASTLVPILEMKNTVDSATALLPNILECEKLLSKIPAIEKDFKKIFDEHSEGISYKQQFLDQNAFLVYYTKGFDGPGRPSIEEEDSSRYTTVLHRMYRTVP
jgi:hypothetical protein